MDMIYVDPVFRQEFWRERLAHGALHEGRVFWVSRGLYTTGRKWYHQMEPNYGTLSVIRAKKDAELYRMAVLDEDLPLLGEDVDGTYDWFFGRLAMIDHLGIIKYRKASPELREAMLHDRDPTVRYVAAESLGEMGDRRYAPDIIRAMVADENEEVRYRAAGALGDLGDPRALVPLREMFEEFVSRMRKKDFVGEEWVKYSHVWCGLVNVLEAMGRIGGELAEETINEAFGDELVHVREAAKRARPRKRVIIPDRSQVYKICGRI